MNKLKPRKLTKKIFNFINDKEIIVIHGSRQVGKTSVLHLVMNKLKAGGSVGNIFYLDLEDFVLLDLCNAGVEKVVSFLKAKKADFDKKVYLFIDEVHYLNNPSSFLKLFHDRYADKIKLIVSGSSSFLIKKKFKNSLAGRIVDFELFTLDFDEFLEFKMLKYDLKEELPQGLQNEVVDFYKEFVIYGGYPAIVLEPVTDKKEIKLKQIINAYIKKDIRDFAEIREIDKFNNLVKILASQIGNLLNIMELCNTVGLAKKTVEEYIFLLENTYIIRRIKPFHRNVRSELCKMPKLFFEDTGMANILANKTFLAKISGGLFENSIYSQLRKNLCVDDIYFWRTNKKQEIDFIIDSIDKNKVRCLSAIEAKIMFMSKYTGSVRYFKRNYDNAIGYFCCLERNKSIKPGHVDIIYPWQIPHFLNIRQ